MKFIFADSLDFVDPNYDFINDTHAEGRQRYWDDQYPHEIMGYAPYDGMLISRGIVSDHFMTGKYTEAQSMRLRRVGAQQFLRMNTPTLKNHLLFGDCGAFTYRDYETPPYTPEDMLEFYEDGQFTHGCSVDHIIFDYDTTLTNGLEGGSEAARQRYDITQANAEVFLQASKQLSHDFTPIGVVQGWSPGSMVEASRSLVNMGYDYIALGGLVPLNVAQIHTAVSAVDEYLKAYPHVKLHLLGFAKADQLKEFTQYRSIASFDSTSPLLRAFKDNKRNYYLIKEDGSLDYYTAIRIPQVAENNTLKRKIRQGLYRQEDLYTLEKNALNSIRAYDKQQASLEETLEAIMAYARILVWDDKKTETSNQNKLNNLQTAYTRTLSQRPWKQCTCPICQKISVEVIIFRASNRNKRRGMHNLDIFYNYLHDLRST
ncbi:tRNA-guanine transglycosylase DpdA [Candidatus Venteria ishoeyi]|uniref:Queuine tRNA-ribosyltransferase n=1 Tax=Candidatus Venteria ishoeyi TaxID=1899563 RepID=A0A1H6F8L3_9GAMM|nr:tRNA-guanine transglycosylase DpdA [Candidatus Venteria ishoeyi]SEH06430.1 Uncharacterised protein [Candidatus Venteria ishoeyi]